jgi:phosphoribosyl-ATP pyrophosphohydrolase
MEVLFQRKSDLPGNSYTTTLFLAGKSKISAKVFEECTELIDAFTEEKDKKSVIHETADLFYHVFVLLTDCGVSLNDIEAELVRRFGISGLEEKAARNQQE